MWDYAKLSAEAAKRGGPAALRSAYKLAGVKKGIEVGLRAGRGQGFIVGGGLVGGAWLYSKLNARTAAEQVGASAAEAPTACQEATVPPTGALTAPSVADGIAEGDPQPDPAK
ncbi:hypothetical protein ACH475_32135 [Streptomyces globisporus]|uniref:hypothetical protein n=1 Tax=Streptomyces globisporus TaxID=1908 RepID=UPI0037A8DD25